MKKSFATTKPRVRFVDHIPDLMAQGDDSDSVGRTKVRIRIAWTDKGIEIIGDSANSYRLDDLLRKMGAREVEGVLCG